MGRRTCPPVSGMSSRGCPRADFTYCTGIVKKPVVLPENLKWTGRLLTSISAFSNNPGKNRIKTGRSAP